MARRRKLSPERKEFINGLLEHYQPSDAHDVQEMLKDLLGDTLQGMLEAEMDEKLGYSRYDYKNKETDDSRNGFLRWSRARSRIFSSSTFILCTPSPGLFLPHTVDKYSTERMETKEAALRRLRHSSTYDIDMTIGTFEG